MALFTQAELDRISGYNAVDKQKKAGTYVYTPAASTPTSSNSNSTPYSQGNNYGSSYTPSNTPAPPAITQQAKPQTSPSGQTQLPSWMGNMYSQVPGTNYYSTNPSNPNSSKFYQDGSPVASMGYSDDKGFKFDGYGTPEIFQQVMKLANVPNGAGLSGVGDVYKSGIASGQLTPNSAIYAPSGGYVSQPSSGGSMNSSSGTVYAPQSTMTNVPKLTGTQQSATDWINNSSSGQGGIANYINMQQAKYDNAVRSGDQNMLNALNADMQRVGYSLSTSSGGQSGPSGQSVGTALTNPTNNGAVQLPNGGFAPGANQFSGQGQTSNNGAVQLPSGGWAPPAYGQMSPDQIKAEAAAKIQQQIADRTRIANQTKTGFNTSYDRLQSQTKDNRALENFQNSQLLNPFNGSSDYAQGQIAREREITDRQNQQDLQTRLGSVDTQLADFLNATPEQQQQIINDLTRQEREYGLQTNAQSLQSQNQNFNQNLATNQFNQQAQNQNFNQNLQTNQFNQQTQNQQFNQQQAVKQQHIDLANSLSQMFNTYVYPTEDPMLSYAQVAGIPTTAAQKIAIDAQNSSFDNAVKKALAENTINKTQADILQGAQQLAISRQNANTSAASQGTSAARLAFEKEQSGVKSQGKQASTAAYSEFLTDLPRLANREEGISLVDAYRQEGIDEATLQTMLKAINSQFKE